MDRDVVVVVAAARFPFAVVHEIGGASLPVQGTDAETVVPKVGRARLVSLGG
jgi:hypothetical protein